MGMYKELDVVICDYVGYVDSAEICLDEVSDPVLHESITNELTRYLNTEVTWDKLSKDAQYCYKEWESVMRSYREYNNERN